MQPTVSDLVVFLYNLGVVLSGGYVVMRFDIEGRLPFFALMFVFAVFWTAYFRFTMYGRLVELERRSAESPDA